VSTALLHYILPSHFTSPFFFLCDRVEPPPGAPDTHLTTICHYSELCWQGKHCEFNRTELGWARFNVPLSTL